MHAGSPCQGADGDANCSESCNEAGDSCTAADANGSACNDGLFCNGADTCVSGSCTAHAGDPCPGADGDDDCSEACNETTDACTSNDPNASPCNDGLFCTQADTCSSGQCVGSGSPCPGADGDSNCAESCNETSDACTAADTNGSACNDGLFCNGADTCASGSCTGHAGNPCPGADGDGDCSEMCNEAADDCSTNDPNASPCSDGLSCTTGDACSAGVCTAGQNNCGECGDGSVDAGEGCDDGNTANGDCCSSTCQPVANTTPCNDGLFCNGADTCAGGACSQHAGDPCPGPDGDGNCAESCNEDANTCTAADVNGSTCSDDVFCNGADTCSAGACSQHAGNVCTGPDGDSDCKESCNESAKSCNANDPAGSACDDGVFCNGADTCGGGQCSQHAGTPCAGADGDGNCAESCDETADACTAADPNGSACNDNAFCNGADTCSDGTCSAHAGDPCPGSDGDANCAESCNEASDTCAAIDPNGSTCSDGNDCSVDDACTAGVCGGEPSPDCTVTTTTLPAFQCGDANQDGRITSGDALKTLRTAVGSSTCEIHLCDFTGDGSIKAADALAILRKAVGLFVTPKCPAALMAMISTTVPSTSTTLPARVERDPAADDAPGAVR